VLFTVVVPFCIYLVTGCTLHPWARKRIKGITYLITYCIVRSDCVVSYAILLMYAAAFPCILFLVI